MKTFILLFVVFLFRDLPGQSFSEFYSSGQRDGKISANTIVINADTFAYFSLPWITIEKQMPFATKKKYEQWTRLKHNVKKAYPYAIMAAARLKEYEQVLKTMPDEQIRKKYMAAAEQQLQKEFGDELKNLTINQGRILIKLIDRETGSTSYELVKQLRGSKLKQVFFKS